MKRINLICVSILFVIAGCKQSNNQNEGLITVDVMANYPKKELILQDFMDVEYIPLETNDEFINQGFVQAVGKDIILVKNRMNDGDIFVYDRNGKAIRKINHKGQGSEEYINILGITLDEDNGEMFVNSSSAKRVLVYDLEGNFKRSFRHKEGTRYNYIYNFDWGNLICYDGFFNVDDVGNMQPLMIISKQDGSITKEIQIPFKEKKLTVVMSKDIANDRVAISGPSYNYPIIPSLGSWIIVEPSSDTIYKYLTDYSMVPLIVRTPMIQSMDPEVFLFPSILTDRYYFMKAVEKVYNFEKQQGFPSIDLMYDRSEKAIFEYTVYNDDFSNRKQVNMASIPLNHEIATWQLLQAHQLVEAYEKGQLKGKLKEIAATLNEESNPVIMIAKHKNND